MTRKTPATLSAAIGSAVVAGAFTLIVCGLLIYTAFAQARSEPLNWPGLSDLQQQLAERPKDEQVKREIRAADLELRRQYFQRRQFAQRGIWLLLGGAAVFLLALRTAISLSPVLPSPKPQGDERAQLLHAAALARWSVSAVGVAIIGAAAVAAVISAKSYAPPAQAPVQTAVEQPGKPVTEEDYARNWPRFRGPTGCGVAPAGDYPETWDAATGRNILWKSPVPLPGHSSPIVWGDRVFVTGADKQQRKVFCFDAKTGALLWQRAVQTPDSPGQTPNVFEESAEPSPTSGSPVLAAATPATDGSRIFAVFANGDVACFDFGGRRLWARSLGLPDNPYGHATSLLTYGQTLLVLLDQGQAEDNKSRLLALDVETGQASWDAPRPVGSSWATPILIDVNGGKQLVTAAKPYVMAYEPASGTELWRVNCLSGDVVPSPIFAGGLVFAVHTEAALSALKPDGAGDVTETHVAWKGQDGLPDITSPVSDGQCVLLVTSGGKLTCYAAGDGKKLWENDLEGTFESSPTFVGDRVYLTNKDGLTVVFAAGQKYAQVGTATLGSAVHSCPAFVGGRIYIRAKDNLYCIGKTKT